MPGQHGTSLKDYTQALTTQLRLRKVPGAVIGQVVAEVESHVRETGGDPVEAFGQPGSYSAQFAGDRKRGGRFGWPTLLGGAAVCMAVVGGWMLWEGIFSLGGVVSVTSNMALAWAAMGLMFALVVCRVEVVMADRETRTVTAGRPVQGSRAAEWLRFLALFATFGVGNWIRYRAPEGSVLLRLPGGTLLLVGLVLTAGSLWLYLGRSDPILDPRRSSRT